MVAIYCDAATLADIAKYAADDRVQGFTTNPSLMRKAGITDYRAFAKEVLSLANGKDVSFEVLADDANEMERQACIIAAWGENVWVKIPVTFCDGIYTTELIQRLQRQNVKVNITAVMTAQQIDVIGNAHGYGRYPLIVSIFAGRISDTGVEPTVLFNYAAFRYARKQVRFLWASTRAIVDLKWAETCGAHIITMTPDLIGKLSLHGKDLAEYSLETVKMFHNDGKGITL